MSKSSCGIQLIDSASKTVFGVDALLTILAMIWMYYLYRPYMNKQEAQRRHASDINPIPWSTYMPFIMIIVLYAFVLLFDGIAMDAVKDKNARQGFSYIGLLAALALLGYIFYITYSHSGKKIDFITLMLGMFTAMIATSSIIFHSQIIVAADN